MSNMSHHRVLLDGMTWKTAEHAFQALRFPVGHPIRNTLNNIKSPMDAKMMINRYRSDFEIIPCSDADLDLMRLVVSSKLVTNDLYEDLLATDDKIIVEDVTKRQHGNGLFWGMANHNGNWVGENWLRKIWMEQRSALQIK